MQGSMRPRSATAPTARATLSIQSVYDSEGTEKADIRDSSKHALINAEHQIRDLRASHGGSTKYILQSKVIKITDVFPCCMRESQRVAPKKPLEADNGRGHN